MTASLAARTARPKRSGGWVPVTLIARVVVPAIAGSLRLVEPAGGPNLIPATPRLIASLVPVIAHIVSALGYAVLGFAVALSALWLTLFYPRQPGTGELATQWFGTALFGTSELTTDLALVAGWAVNLAVAEYVIRRPSRRRSVRRPTLVTAKAGSA